MKSQQEQKDCQQNKISQFQLNCPYSNQNIIMVCASKMCIKPALCCIDQNCTCYAHHENCMLIPYKKLVNRIKSKIVDYQPILSHVNELFDSIIDEISKTRQQAEKLIKNYGLKKPQIQFISCINDGTSELITGKMIFQANKISLLPNTIDFSLTNQIVDKIWEQVGHLAMSPIYQIRDILQWPLNTRIRDKNKNDKIVPLIKKKQQNLKVNNQQQQLNQQQLQQNPYNSELQIIGSLNDEIENKISENRKNKIFIRKQQQVKHEQQFQYLQKLQSKQVKDQQKIKKQQQQDLIKQKIGSKQDILKNTLKQIIQYIYQVLGVDPQKCVKFILQNGIQNGQLLDKQAILAKALQDPDFLA